jgi:hypothetical protein
MIQIKMPLEFLLNTSRSSLEALELARRDRSSNLAKEIQGTLEQWVAAEVEAQLARCILEGLKRLAPPLTTSVCQPLQPFDRKQLILRFPSSLDAGRSASRLGRTPRLLLEGTTRQCDSLLRIASPTGSIRMLHSQRPCALTRLGRTARYAVKLGFLHRVAAYIPRHSVVLVSASGASTAS